MLNQIWLSDMEKKFYINKNSYLYVDDDLLETLSICAEKLYPRRTYKAGKDVAKELRHAFMSGYLIAMKFIP